MIQSWFTCYHCLDIVCAKPNKGWLALGLGCAGWFLLGPVVVGAVIRVLAMMCAIPIGIGCRAGGGVYISIEREAMVTVIALSDVSIL